MTDVPSPALRAAWIAWTPVIHGMAMSVITRSNGPLSARFSMSSAPFLERATSAPRRVSASLMASSNSGSSSATSTRVPGSMLTQVARTTPRPSKRRTTSALVLPLIGRDLFRDMQQDATLWPVERPVTWPQKVSDIAGALSVATGVVVLAAWWFEVLRIVRPFAGASGMVPNTATCFFFLGTSLLMLRQVRTEQPWHAVAQIYAVLALGLAVITLIEYTTGRNIKLDDLLSPGQIEAATGSPAGRPGPSSAVCFVLIGLSLLTLDVEEAVRVDLSEVLALAAALIALITAAGYTYGATSLYETATLNTRMAPHTILMVLVLSAGVLCARPERPLMSLVTSERVGGFVVRRLLVGTAFIPLLGVLVMLGERRSLYDEPFAEALLAVAAMAIAVGLVLSTGRTLDRMDAQRAASERAVSEQKERLRDLIREASDGVFLANLDGRYTEVNDAGCRMLGYAREELIGKTIMDIIPEQDRPRLAAVRATLLRGGTH